MKDILQDCYKITKNLDQCRYKLVNIWFLFFNYNYMVQHILFSYGMALNLSNLHYWMEVNQYYIICIPLLLIIIILLLDKLIYM